MLDQKKVWFVQNYTLNGNEATRRLLAVPEDHLTESRTSLFWHGDSDMPVYAPLCSNQESDRTTETAITGFICSSPYWRRNKSPT